MIEFRSFLKVDFAQICQLQSDGKCRAVVESSQKQSVRMRLKIPQCGAEVLSPVLELLSPIPMMSTLDVSNRRSWKTLGWGKQFEEDHNPLQLHYVEPALAEAFAAMNVRAVLMAPIFHQQDLWGMLMIYHTSARPFSVVEIEPVWLAVEQLSAIIAQHQGGSRTSSKITEPSESAISLIAHVLHLEPTLDLQAALETTVRAFHGSGGRLYLFPSDQVLTAGLRETLDGSSSTAAQIYTHGIQPTSSAFAKYSSIEQYHVWQNHFQIQDEPIWAINDLYLEAELDKLQSLFQPTSICSLFMVPLWYGQQCLGYLTIFRNRAEVGTSSYEQPLQKWTLNETKLGQTIGMHFAAALQRSRSQSQRQSLTHRLEQQVQQNAATSNHGMEHQHLLMRVITKIRQSLDIETIFRTTTREICHAVQTERVAVYRFNEDWGGEFVSDFEFATGNWEGLSKLGVNLTWNDTHLQETQGGRYRYKEISVVEDIYTAEYSPCHIEILEQYQIRAFVIVPIFAGKQLWGLLAIYQHSSIRHWDDSDVQFLNQVADQLGVAIFQSELHQKAHQQAKNLQRVSDQQQILLHVITKIRQSLDVETIFRTTTREICHAVQAERVAVYQFNEDWGGQFVNDFEFATGSWEGLSKLGMNSIWDDTYLQETQGGRYRHKETFAVEDIYKAGHSPCHIELLEQYRIRAYAIVPIFVGKNLWGLLAMYQHSRPRQWEPMNVRFLNQVAEQMGVALHQSKLLEQTRK
ncbi:GAF domain-containing protein [Acaryochloris thomasi]|uniref:GAF domain-containing protein n=1 Tax=Acaryochloris thomasi TaxID=2929456 RepID=UPI001313FF56|nr:GAF domain-containing protein [Acaryochloris thomasi]